MRYPVTICAPRAARRRGRPNRRQARVQTGVPPLVATATLQLVLPNGDIRDVTPGTPARDVVASIGPGLLKAAIAVAVDGEVQDLMTPIRKGGAFVVLKENDPRSLPVLRH